MKTRDRIASMRTPDTLGAVELQRLRCSRRRRALCELCGRPLRLDRLMPGLAQWRCGPCGTLVLAIPRTKLFRLAQVLTEQDEGRSQHVERAS